MVNYTPEAVSDNDSSLGIFNGVRAGGHDRRGHDGHDGSRRGCACAAVVDR